MALGLCGKAKQTRAFVEDFKEFYNSCRCAELKGVSGIPCDDLIEHAADKLEEVLNNGNL